MLRSIGVKIWFVLPSGLVSLDGETLLEVREGNISAKEIDSFSGQPSRVVERIDLSDQFVERSKTASVLVSQTSDLPPPPQQSSFPFVSLE